MKVPSSSRSRSGLAWASCSSSRRAGSILGVTVIVVSFFESVFADHSKDHAVAVAYAGDTLTGSRTPLNWTSLEAVHGRASKHHPPASRLRSRAPPPPSHGKIAHAATPGRRGLRCEAVRGRASKHHPRLRG